MPHPFLTAEWRSLAMLNYAIGPEILRPFVPAGTELDQWQGKTFVSIVGFFFLNTRIRDLAIPFHSNFEEVNLRFYVRRFVGGEWRRGVVFIKELVPRRTIAWTARRFYNENYDAVPMSHGDVVDGTTRKVSYMWSFAGRTNRMEVSVEGEPQLVPAGSGEEFITEHYWGYARQRDGGTVEYQVEHPRWRVWPAREANFDGEVEALYGKTFAPFLAKRPATAFLAEGSAVTVFQGTRLGTS